MVTMIRIWLLAAPTLGSFFSKKEQPDLLKHFREIWRKIKALGILRPWDLLLSLCYSTCLWDSLEEL